jgi:hypothetical protein
MPVVDGSPMSKHPRAQSGVYFATTYDVLRACAQLEFEGNSALQPREFSLLLSEEQYHDIWAGFVAQLLEMSEAEAMPFLDIGVWAQGRFAIPCFNLSLAWARRYNLSTSQSEFAVKQIGLSPETARRVGELAGVNPQQCMFALESISSTIGNAASRGVRINLDCGVGMFDIRDRHVTFSFSQQRVVPSQIPRREPPILDNHTRSRHTGRIYAASDLLKLPGDYAEDDSAEDPAPPRRLGLKRGRVRTKNVSLETHSHFSGSLVNQYSRLLTARFCDSFLHEASASSIIGANYTPSAATLAMDAAKTHVVWSDDPESSGTSLNPAFIRASEVSESSQKYTECLERGIGDSFVLPMRSVVEAGIRKRSFVLRRRTGGAGPKGAKSTCDVDGTSCAESAGNGEENVVDDVMTARVIKRAFVEVRAQFTNSSKKAMVDYILMSNTERRRLGINLIPDDFQPEHWGWWSRRLGHPGLERPPEWTTSFELARKWMQDNFLLTSPPFLACRHLWTEYEDLVLVTVPSQPQGTLRAGNWKPLHIADFKAQQMQQVDRVRSALMHEWYPKVRTLFMRQIEEGASMSTEAALRRYWNAIAAILGSQLRQVVIESMRRLMDFFRSLAVGGERPCFILSPTTTKEGTISFDTGLAEITQGLRDIFDSVVHSFDAVPRVELSSIDVAPGHRIHVLSSTDLAVTSARSELVDLAAGQKAQVCISRLERATYPSLGQSVRLLFPARRWKIVLAIYTTSTCFFSPLNGCRGRSRVVLTP